MTRTKTGTIEEYLTARHGAERSDTIIRVGCALMALVLIITAGLLMRKINALRQENQITLDADSVEGLPAHIALMTKTGTLRAITLVVCFQRLEDQKQNDQKYDLMQLSEWLCGLAPRYAKVWSYAAWNMAYNVSVLEYTPEARWLWVSNGIEALRDKGIPYNPESVTLYKELGWIFHHKIGDKLDDHHRAYKMELAVQMQRYFGTPPAGQSAQDAIDAFRRIVDAPRDWHDTANLAARHPDLAPFIKALGEVDLLDSEAFLKFVALDEAGRQRAGMVAEREDLSEEEKAEQALFDRRRAVLSDPRFADAYPRYLAIIRSRAIRETLHMNLDWMLTLMTDPPWLAEARDKVVEKYGPDAALCPIDWRLPHAHSLYWCTYGDHVTKDALTLDDADSMNTVRLIFFSLENLASAGKLVLEPNFERPNRSFLQMLPDNRFIAHMHEAYLHYGKEQFGEDERFVAGTSGPNYWGGHRNFLIDSIQRLYIAGGDRNLEQAKEYFFYLREFDRDTAGNIKPQYQQTFEQFVYKDLYEDLDTQKRAQAFISEILLRSLKEAGADNTDAALYHLRKAREWWNHYMRDKLDTDRNDRRRLQPLLIMRRDRAMALLLDPSYSLLQKSKVWKALDLLTRQHIYDGVIEAVNQWCAQHQPPYDPAKVLPEPPGMEEFRKNPEAHLKPLEIYREDVFEGSKIQEL